MEQKRKINKLRRLHIIPSIIFFIVTIVLTYFAWEFLTSFMFSYFTTDRISDEYNNAWNISRIIERNLDDEEAVLGYIKENDFSEAVYIINDDNNIIAGYGSRTYVLEKSGVIEIYENCSMYLDENSAINVNESLEEENFVNYALKGKRSYIQFIFDWGFEGRKRVVVEDDFWIGIKLKDGNTLLVKSKIEYYSGDYLLSNLIGAIFFILMFIPLMFLFLNVINNIINQRRIKRFLYLDPVTLGYSWSYYEERTAKLLRSKNAYALVDFTLTKYDAYSACHGTKAAEDILVMINKCINARIEVSRECCAHYSKADFALLLKVSNQDDCIKRVEKLINGLPNALNHPNLIFKAGIYFAEISKNEKKIFNRKKINVPDLFIRASNALSSADDSQNVVIFDQKILDDQIWEHKVEEKMEQALKNEEFQVYLQPKYNPVNEEMTGAEALIRWINAEDGFISPGRFIPIFEKNGFITKIDDYMISHVAELQARWISEGKKVVPVSVNVSRLHFANPRLAERICELVDKYNVPHELIEIELTESAFFDDKNLLLDTVKRLKEYGFFISMDDFGAGYSSLNSLKDLPLDVLKLDAEFFRGEDLASRGDIVVSQAISLAKKLNMKIVAEGVEKKDQVDFLVKQNCDMIQGFYYARPMPASDYEQKLSSK